MNNQETTTRWLAEELIDRIAEMIAEIQQHPSQRVAACEGAIEILEQLGLLATMILMNNADPGWYGKQSLEGEDRG